MSLEGKTLFITGGSRGIGLSIALRAARDGANVVIAAKTAEPHPVLKGTIYSAAEQIERAGGRALPLVLDVRNVEAIEKSVELAFRHFGAIDICINNASAIDLSLASDISASRYDLMQQINVRGTLFTSCACVRRMLGRSNPHVLSLSPPLDIRSDWLGQHLPYTLSKYGMSMVMLGMSQEYKGRIAFNALWPRTTIATAAIEFKLGGGEALRRARRPEIMADAAYAMLQKPAAFYTGRFELDEDVLRQNGATDFGAYRCDPSTVLQADLFVDPSQSPGEPIQISPA